MVQPVQEIAEILKEYPHCHLHVDATQAVGKIPVSFEEMCIRDRNGVQSSLRYFLMMLRSISW